MVRKVVRTLTAVVLQALRSQGRGACALLSLVCFCKAVRGLGRREQSLDADGRCLGAVRRRSPLSSDCFFVEVIFLP